MNESILQLALQAIDDADARVVFEDALLEQGPNVTTVDVDRGLLRDAGGRIVGAMPASVRVTVGVKRYEWTHFYTWTQDHSFDSDSARAVAAVLLFGEWSTDMWPIAAAARSPSIVPPWLRTGRGTRAELEHRIRNAAGLHGYQNVEVHLEAGTQWATVRARIVGVVPAEVLDAIAAEIRAELRGYVHLELTALDDPERPAPR